MLHKIFILFGAILVIFWGIAHLFPAKSVVKSFGNISQDNKHIIYMEWISEAFLMILLV